MEKSVGIRRPWTSKILFAQVQNGRRQMSGEWRWLLEVENSEKGTG